MGDLNGGGDDDEKPMHDVRIDYGAASKGETPPGALLLQRQRPTPIIRAKPKSFRWLCQQYLGSAEFLNLEISTKEARRRIIDRLCQEYGNFPYEGVTRTAVATIADKLTASPSARNSIVKAFRYIYSWALERGYEDVDENPARDIKMLPSRNPAGHHAWTIGEIERFEDKHPIGTKARLALALFLYAGMPRVSDVVLLGRQHSTRDGRIRYTQQKNRHRSPVEIDIPMLEELRAVIDKSPTGDLTFLVTEFGKPFTAKGFGNKMRGWCNQAGLPHCASHGLRKAAATRLAELGCSDHEIMAMGGWTTLKEVQRYTRGARKRVMADNASSRLEQDIKRTKVSNPVER